jgi:hypothetical protein
MQALYQLSYGPTREARNVKAGYRGCQGKMRAPPPGELTICIQSVFALSKPSGLSLRID